MFDLLNKIYLYMCTCKTSEVIIIIIIIKAGL